MDEMFSNEYLNDVFKPVTVSYETCMKNLYDIRTSLESFMYETDNYDGFSNSLTRINPSLTFESIDIFSMEEENDSGNNKFGYKAPEVKKRNWFMTMIHKIKYFFVRIGQWIKYQFKKIWAYFFIKKVKKQFEKIKDISDEEAFKQKNYVNLCLCLALPGIVKLFPIIDESVSGVIKTIIHINDTVDDTVNSTNYDKIKQSVMNSLNQIGITPQNLEQISSGAQHIKDQFVTFISSVNISINESIKGYAGVIDKLIDYIKTLTTLPKFNDSPEKLLKVLRNFNYIATYDASAVLGDAVSRYAKYHEKIKLLEKNRYFTQYLSAADRCVKEFNKTMLENINRDKLVTMLKDPTTISEITKACQYASSESDRVGKMINNITVKIDDTTSLTKSFKDDEFLKMKLERFKQQLAVVNAQNRFFGIITQLAKTALSW